MKKILLLISQGTELFEIAPFTDVFGWNNIINNDKILLKTCSFHSKIDSVWNLQIIPEIDLSKESINISDFDALVIPGGFGYKGFFTDMKLQEFNNIILHFIKNNKIITGICTGVLTIGEAKGLIGRKATTYLYDNERYFKQLTYYGAIPIKKPIVVDNNLITVSGPKNAIDAAFMLSKILTSEENVQRVKYNMCF